MHSHTAGGSRASGARKGKHPRDPAAPASSDPTQAMPGTDPHGNELGLEGERRHDADTGGASSSSGIHQPPEPASGSGVRAPPLPRPIVDPNATGREPS